MKLLCEIKNKSKLSDNKKIRYKIRRAARAIIFNKNKVPILYVSKYEYYKLPGGGLNHGESIKDGLSREIMEETGCTAKIKKEVGRIIEYRSKIKLKQTSYCFIGKIDKINKKQDFTDKEKSDGFKLIWITLNKAIKLVEKSRPSDYSGRFIVKRDLIFLKKAREMLK